MQPQPLAHAIRTIVVPNAELLIGGQKTATLALATTLDRYRTGTTWHPVTADRRPPAWQPGQLVDEVDHAGRHKSIVGQVIQVRSIHTMQVIGAVLVESIEMVNVADVTQEQAQALGYPNRQTYLAEWAPLFDQRRGWLKRVSPAPPIPMPSRLQ